MEIVNNLETILENQEEVAKQAETDKVVEAAVAEKPSEIEERVKNWRCPICKRGYQECHCKYVKEAEEPGRGHGRRTPHPPDQVSPRAAERRKKLRRMQKRSRRINRGR